MLLKGKRKGEPGVRAARVGTSAQDRRAGKSLESIHYIRVESSVES
jgi:hypothetical protein